MRLFATPWVIACQTSLSMGFLRQEYWSELPFPSPGDHSNPGIKPGSPALQGDSLTSWPQVKPRYSYSYILYIIHINNWYMVFNEFNHFITVILCRKTLPYLLLKMLSDIQ